MSTHRFPAIAVIVVVLALGLSACGFHLRNALVLPPDVGTIHVAARDPYSPLAQLLVQAIDRAGVTATAEDPTEGMSTLRIRSEKWGSLPISVDQFGRSQEYTLRYAVVFSLTKPDGTVLVPQQAVELARDYISVPTNSTGTEGERELLVKELQKDMTASILRRIDAASRAPQPAAAPPADVDVPGDGVVEPASEDTTLPDPTATP